MPSITKPFSIVGASLLAFVAILVATVRLPSTFDATQVALIQPIVALVTITAVVWCLMVVYRNLAFARGLASERYFQTYTSDAPREWVERPARAYMNLLELPILFYAVCSLMLATDHLDGTQVALAWLFVATRGVHAFIYIAFNYVPLRFAAFAAGAITLGVLWARFALGFA